MTARTCRPSLGLGISTTEKFADYDLPRNSTLKVRTESLLEGREQANALYSNCPLPRARGDLPQLLRLLSKVAVEELDGTASDQNRGATRREK